MEHIAKFKKADEYVEVNLPKRATKGSAGYDFELPNDILLYPGDTVLIPTGIKVDIAEGWVLMLFPRSGLSFKYRLQLDNTVGVIDSDFKNEIMVKMTYCKNEGKPLGLQKGDRFCQGVFLPYGITEDDGADGERNGGMGSTGER